MNKLAEQLSNDIAIRAAQKLAALNGGMQKTAGITVGEALGGGLGALGGLAGAYMNSDEEDPAGLGTYLASALGGAGMGMGAGMLLKALGKRGGGVNPAAADPIMNASQLLGYNPNAGAADAYNKLQGLLGGLGPNATMLR
jgi:hypothetical protein